jgi:hypothetical protein
VGYRNELHIEGANTTSITVSYLNESQAGRQFRFGQPVLGEPNSEG